MIDFSLLANALLLLGLCIPFVIPFAKNKFINSARLLPAVLCLRSKQLIQASLLAPGFGPR